MILDNTTMGSEIKEWRETKPYTIQGKVNLAERLATAYLCTKAEIEAYESTIEDVFCDDDLYDWFMTWTQKPGVKPHLPEREYEEVAKHLYLEACKPMRAGKKGTGRLLTMLEKIHKASIVWVNVCLKNYRGGSDVSG